MSVIGAAALAVALLAVATCAAGGGSGPNDWKHTPRQGIDSRVGDLHSPSRGLTIHYDIGRLAGNYAQFEPKRGPVVWARSGRLLLSAYESVLSERDGVQTLTVTFPGEGPANYRAEVRDQDDIDAVFAALRARKALTRPKP